MSILKIAMIFTLPCALVANSSFAETKPAKPTIASDCTACHKAEANTLIGYFDKASFKAKVLQISIDKSVELVNFDVDTIQVTTAGKQTGDGELLYDDGIKRGHEIKLVYTEANGVKTATRLTAKPPALASASMLISLAEVEKLVAKGTGYHLYDARPLSSFQEGAIPTAVSLPYNAFDATARKVLPSDRNAPIVFYCAGNACNMGLNAGERAKKLGYTNVKVFLEGIPAWSQRNYIVITPKSYKEVCQFKGMSVVLLDVRPEAEAAKGFIKGAVSFPAKSADKLISSLNLPQKDAPVVLYEAAGGQDAKKVAEKLIKAGYRNVKLILGGFKAWKAANYEVATGKIATKIQYAERLKHGEVDIDEFRKQAAAPSPDVMIVDVRSTKDTAAGMLKTAVNIPLLELQQRAGELPKDKLILLQCQTGNQSEMAYHLLLELGYTRVKYLNARVTFAPDGNYFITKE